MSETLADIIVRQLMRYKRFKESTDKDGGSWKLRREIEAVLVAHENQCRCGITLTCHHCDLASGACVCRPIFKKRKRPRQ